MNVMNGDDAVKIKISSEENKAPEIKEVNGSDGEENKIEKSPEKCTKAELIEKLSEKEKQVNENYDLYLRANAELENVKKRSKKDKEDWVKYSNESLIKEILPVLDNLEMAIAHSKNENSLDALREGVELTLKGMKDALKKSGLKELEAKGEIFDPCYHHAVSEQSSDEADAGTVLEELQKGYLLHDRLIRPSMVVISKGGDDDGNKKASEKVCDK